MSKTVNIIHKSYKKHYIGLRTNKNFNLHYKKRICSNVRQKQIMGKKANVSHDTWIRRQNWTIQVP